MEDRWMEELDQICRKDAWYQLWLARVEELEMSYEQVRGILDKTQKESLDRYIMACEELDHARIALAYQLGRVHGKQELRIE